MDFSAWWSEMTLLEQIYWGLALPFTLFFILQLILTFFGSDVPEDGGADFDVETDDGIPFQFLTIKNLIAFFTIFSWTGITCLDSGYSNFNAIIVSLIAGIIMMLIMSSIYYFLAKADESGTLNIQKAVGAVGEVYLRLEKNRGNIGQVQVQVQGSLRTLDALTDDEEDLAFGAVVTVTKVLNENILVVTKSKLA